ncbi:phosphotransferase enzyme family protein [Nocardia nova]|uniref:phosphotransferase enzyme family protein n=1 Tax=Nocardia nova TaxID=37330 RepID=UPI0033F507F1
MTDIAARDVLTSACERVGLDTHDARLLRAHSNAVWLLPHAQAVIRIGRKQHRGLRFEAGLALTRWLAEHDVPVTEPLMDQPVEIDDAIVTVWRFYPQDHRGEPPMRDLGAILRQLHTLQDPAPVELRPYPPLSGLTTILGSQAAREVLEPGDRAWLEDRAGELVARYEGLESVLGVGLIHGDAYGGNCLWDGDRVVLGDWDEASVGPREQDLILSCHDHLRFGASEHDLRQFFTAYGLELEEFRTWPAFDVLISMRDLHTLTGYIRRAAADDSAAAGELHRRLGMLRNPSAATAPWHGL